MTYDERNDRGIGAGGPGVSSPGRLTPERARQIPNARFATAGLDLVPGVTIELNGSSLVLDGYHAGRAAGYVYFGADPSDPARADIAQDFSRACADLAASGERYILFVFQEDMPTSDALERRIDAFFAGLPR